MRIIPISINNEYVAGANVVVGAAGSHNDVALRITFDEMWDGLTKRITWLDATGNNPVLTILTTNLLEPGTTNTYIVPIPHGPKQYEGEMVMTIKGAEVEDDLEKRATMSVRAEFIVLPSAWDDDADEEQDVSPTQAEQLQAEIDAVIEDISEIQLHKTDAEAWAVGKRGGEDVDEEDDTYHNNAKYYATQSAGSAVAAYNSAEDAAGSASAAEDSASAAATSKTGADSAKDAAVTAKDAAESAQDAAETAQADAEDARDAAEGYKNAAAASAQAIEDLTVEATTLAPGSEATVEKVTESGHEKFIFGIPEGLKGETGSQGPQGAAGPQGIQGEKGDTGEKGDKGDKGDTGAKGDTGSQGPQGVQGPEGTLFIPSVSADGIISWTNTGGKENPDPVNIKGPQGDQGEQGVQGPQGIQGIQGIQGEQGPQGETGRGFSILGYYATVEELEAAVPFPQTGDAYGVGTALPYDIYIWDGAENAWINNGPIQGAKGDKGDTGSSGVYLGTTQPTDPTIKVWIKPDGEGSEVATKAYVDGEVGDLQEQIDAITSQSDVVDVVATYDDVASYSKPLYLDDIIKCLSDSQYSDSVTYYRYTNASASGISRFTYIGSVAAYYTKSETDSKIAAAIGSAIAGSY